MEQAYNRDNSGEVSMKKNKFHPKGLVGNPEGMLKAMKSGESNPDVLRRWQVKDVKTRWAVYDDGLKIWFDGEAWLPKLIQVNLSTWFRILRYG
jgi:hypothetical protein